ncbi:hypothetical protein F5Y10DRAFT_290968 [Nemania abortiva]|nr:hypothetical protein F5Y10DRAFT_290968 [Nemania abortiva]
MVAQWKSLPLEVKHMIFEILLLQPRKRHQISSYATVSKEWQIFFEKHIFHRLVLRQSQIKKFGQLFQTQGQRRELLRHLWLRIELPKYDLNTSIEYETEPEANKNDQIVTKAVWQLLEILSSWRGKDAELTLELSVNSPSDSQHYLVPEYPLGEGDIYPHFEKEDCTYKGFHAHMSRKRRRRRINAHKIRERECQLNRIFDRCFDLDIETAKIPQHSQLSRAQVVKKLLIRRQYVCSFSSDALFKIIESLPGLESISLETEPTIMQGLEFGRELDRILQSNMSLKSLSIFEGNIGPRRFNRIFSDLLSGSALAHDSYLLEHLSVSFAVDAGDFFQGFWPGTLPVPTVHLVERQRQPDQWKANGTNHGQTLHTTADKRWLGLKSLALTSSLLHPGLPKITIDGLLQAAANAAIEMPSLRVMEIWNYDKDSNVVCIFQYRRVGNNGCPTIYLSNTWGYRLPLGVVNSWSIVSTMQAGRDVRVSEQNLDLEGLFLHPLSRYPSPFLAKVTDFYGVVYSFKRNLHLKTWQDHQQYDIHLDESVSKAKCYQPGNMNPAMTHVFDTIDKHVHRIKRRLVGQIVTDQSVRIFEPKMFRQATIFIWQILSSCQQEPAAPIDILRLEILFYALAVIQGKIFLKALSKMIQLRLAKEKGAGHDVYSFMTDALDAPKGSRITASEI